MRPPLLVSLLALTLAAHAALYFHRSPSAPTSASQPLTGPGSSRSTNPTGNEGRAAPDPLSWAHLQTDDPKSLIERLRAAGFPPEAIRAIISAQINQQYSARRATLVAQQEEIPFWKPQQRFLMNPKTMAELRELSREQANLLKELLGPAGVPANEEREAYQRRQFGNLPSDKIDQLQEIISDYGDLRNQIYATANGVMLPEDRETLALLEKEQRADLAAILTPGQLEDYELRSSTTANLLRSQLGIFNPSEAEFRAIYAATRTAEDRYGSITSLGVNRDQMQQVQAALLDQARAFLTPERYADLQQAVDPAQQTINRLVTRLELPPSTAPQILAIQQDISKQANALRSDRSLSADQRQTQLNRLADDATARLTATLGGSRGLEAYKQYGGQWLQSLQPRPAPTRN